MQTIRTRTHIAPSARALAQQAQPMEEEHAQVKVRPQLGEVDVEAEQHPHAPEIRLKHCRV